MSDQPNTSIPPKRESSDRRPTVLVVEDEAPLLAMIHTILEKAGYYVLDAATAEEALHVWELHQGDVQLLLTDLVLPEGLNGQELARQLKSKRPGLAVVYTSGYLIEMAPDDGEPLVEGVNFLQKPYRPKVMIETVRDRLSLSACEHSDRPPTASY